MQFETTKDIEIVPTFDDMDLKEQLIRGIYQYGFEKPSAIQQRAIVPIIKGRDVIAQAQSGTGKTSLIAVTVCQIVDTASPEYVDDVLSLVNVLCTYFLSLVLYHNERVSITNVGSTPNK